MYKSKTINDIAKALDQMGEEYTVDDEREKIRIPIHIEKGHPLIVEIYTDEINKVFLSAKLISCIPEELENTVLKICNKLNRYFETSSLKYFYDYDEDIDGYTVIATDFIRIRITDDQEIGRGVATLFNRTELQKKIYDFITEFNKFFAGVDGAYLNYYKVLKRYIVEDRKK